MFVDKEFHKNFERHGVDSPYAKKNLICTIDNSIDIAIKIEYLLKEDENET